MSNRDVEESPVKQGIDEKISYKFNWKKKGIPSMPVVKLYDITNGGYIDVSSTKLEGSPSIEDEQYVITPKVKALVNKHQYRLECLVFINQNTQESYSEIYCEL